MKLTKTKLREMVYQELKEISGTVGGTSDIKKVKSSVANVKAKKTDKK